MIFLVLLRKNTPILDGPLRGLMWDNKEYHSFYQLVSPLEGAFTKGGVKPNKNLMQSAPLRTTITAVYSLLISLTAAYGQVFLPATGAVVSQASDSRSVNFLDLNNDGWEDLFISNGLQGGQPDLLYLNDGTGNFTPVTDQDIVKASNPADGASFVDYNNDGHIDGMISSWYGSEDLLYLNTGNGKLKYNAQAGIVSGSFAETASFGDFNGDGWLDLYVTNSGGTGENYLYRNLRNGKFRQVTNHSLVAETKTSRGAIWLDYNDDGYTDLFVTNEGNNSNDLFKGKANGTYEKITTGDLVTQTRSSMTASWGDIDNDGDFDVFIGNAGWLVELRNQLFENTGNGFTAILTDTVARFRGCTFGSAFADFDNDGDLDLAISNGFCSGNMENRLYENQGDGSFTDVTNLLPANANICSYGLAWGDVNNDGFQDLAIANCKNGTTDTEKNNSLYLNQGNSNGWLKVKLQGTQSNTSAIGAKIRLKATINGKAVWQIREIRSQSGYAGQNSLVAHFGLGDAQVVDTMYIDWPATGREMLTGISINQQLTAVEGSTNSIDEPISMHKIRIHLYPSRISPQTEQIWLEIENKKGFQAGEVALFNALGQELWKQEVNVIRGKTKLAIPLALATGGAGLYHVCLRIGEETISKKLLLE